ncbi:MAG: LysR family transcriptional regulator [Psychromonas sp.]
MINPNWLKTFCTLAEIGHFTQTSEKLFMTQSGVSQHIKKLEQQLDTELLIREGKSFTLTESGKLLYQQGNNVLQSLYSLKQSIKQDNEFEGVINIKSPGSIGLKLYPYLLEIQQQHKNLIFNYEFSPNKAIEASLTEHQCDIGLMTTLAKQEKLRSEKISNEALVLITSSDITEISWQTLLEIGFIAHPDAAHHAHLLLSENYEQFEHIEQFKQVGFSNQISLILEPVSKGIGFAVLPIHAATAFHKQESITIHHLTKSISEPIYLCHNPATLDTQRSKYIRTLITEFLN